MPRSVAAILVRLRGGTKDVPRAYCAESYAADVSLVCGFVLALGIPVFYQLGFEPAGPIGVGYLASAVLASALVALLVWRLRWGSYGPRLCKAICQRVLLYAAPSVALVALMVMAGHELALVGVSVMAYVAAVAIASSHAILRNDIGKPIMRPIRVLCALATPLLVLGLADYLPGGVIAVEGWSVSFAVAVAGALGARHALLYHLEHR